MNRVLFALLAFLLAGLALGESTEPTRIRITTWNLEWFPSGSANEASIEQQNQRIKEEAETGKNIRKREVAIAQSSSASTDTSVALIIAKTVSPFLRFIRFTEPVVMIEVTGPAAVLITISETTCRRQFPQSCRANDYECSCS